MTKRIPLHGKHADGRFAIVDDEDFARISAFKWILSARDYALRSATEEVLPGIYRNETVYMHKAVLGIGRESKVDHANGDTLDNTRANLRRCTQQENMMNRRKQAFIGRAPCSSRFKGVAWQSHRLNWSAQIKLNSETRHLGVFDDEQHAALAYDRAARELFGDFAHLNFPQTMDYSMVPERKPVSGSGYWGVTWDKSRGKWQASVRHEGRTVHVGRFGNLLEAARARDEKALEIQGDRARLNFPREE